MITTAVVGTGSIAASCHLPAVQANREQARVVAAVDVNAERVQAFCGEHGIAGAYTDLAEMLERERPDLVQLCSPPAVHLDQIATCLRAGTSVWCEKPVCLSLAECDAIADAERASRGFVSVVAQHRFGSGARHLRRLVTDGVLGRPLVVQCVTAWHRDEGYFDVPWRGGWGTDGGPTLTLGIHQIDLMLSVLGDWTEIVAMTGRLERSIETGDVATALVRFADGAMATIVTSVLSQREESYLRFDFTGATVELRHLYGYRNENWTCMPARLWSPSDDEPSTHAAQLRRLLDCMRRVEQPPMSVRTARRAVELVTGLYAAALTGKPVARTDLVPGHPFYARLDGGQGNGLSDTAAVRSF